MAKDGERWKMSLPVKLTERELLAEGELLAAANTRYCEIEAEKKAANDDFKERLDDARKEMNRRTHTIETGEENRMVVVARIDDLDRNHYTVVRQDTGEVVKGPIAIPAEERQRQLLS